ncbi:MAG: hypothetical protein JO194_09955, partial [Candidatus Eremiobacteraeota bacterium]|nr:hypothetical protein [Candidatus Eremiobacteraeota bacterium]
MNPRVAAALPVMLLAALALAVGACGGTATTSSSTNGGGSKGLNGCNSGATSVSLAAEALTFGHRPPERGPRADYLSGKIAVRFADSGAGIEIAQALARLHATQYGAANLAG